jgi:hypothetical protein
MDEALEVAQELAMGTTIVLFILSLVLVRTRARSHS